MSNQQDIIEIEVSMEDAKHAIELAEKLEKLMNNKQFKEVILEEYFKNEAVRLVGLKADPNCQTPEWKQNIENSLMAISELRMFFMKIRWQANQAEAALEDAKNAHAELLAEGAE